MDERPADAREPSSAGGDQGESLALGVLVGAAFALALAGASFLLAFWVGPWVGVAASAASLVVWTRYGPPPGPGHLRGLVSVNGLALVAGTLVACLVLALRS